MPITAMAGRRMTLSRRTAFVLDSVAMTAVLTSVSPTRQPSTGSFIEVTVSGSGGSGTVSVVGFLGGVPDTQVLTFSGPGTQVTVTRFDSITSIDYSAGWSASNSIEALAVGSDGSRQNIHYNVATSVVLRLDRGRGSWRNPASGRVEFEKTRVYIDYTTLFSPREGDVFVDEVSGEEWEVKTHPDLFGGGTPVPHHWELEVEMRKQASTS